MPAKEQRTLCHLEELGARDSLDIEHEGLQRATSSPIRRTVCGSLRPGRPMGGRASGGRRAKCVEVDAGRIHQTGRGSATRRRCS
jgi:hypothetical protein